MYNYNEQSKVMREPFCLETHKRTFINYLEIIILEDGTAVYAVPSHQEKLISIACARHNVTREELDALCPPKYYTDFMYWLSYMAAAIPVWNVGYKGDPNEKQQTLLDRIYAEGLMESKGSAW